MRAAFPTHGPTGELGSSHAMFLRVLSPSVIKANLLNPYCLCVRYNNVPRQISALLFENDSDYCQSLVSSPPSLSFTLIHVVA